MTRIVRHDGPSAPPRAESLWERRPWLRRVISTWLILHLVAIVVAPLAVSPTSLLCQRVWTVFRPYLDVLYLNHGYHFFAPEPGPSHLVRYELRFHDGRVRQEIFPNKTQHRPRLLYHRHFMLSEFLNSLAIDEGRRDLFEAVAQSYAEHVRHQSGADEVRLHLRRHYLPSPQHVLAGKRLDDATLFAERPIPVRSTERR